MIGSTALCAGRFTDSGLCTFLCTNCTNEDTTVCPVHALVTLQPSAGQRQVNAWAVTPRKLDKCPIEVTLDAGAKFLIFQKVPPLLACLRLLECKWCPFQASGASPLKPETGPPPRRAGQAGRKRQATQVDRQRAFKKQRNLHTRRVSGAGR